MYLEQTVILPRMPLGWKAFNIHLFIYAFILNYHLANNKLNQVQMACWEDFANLLHWINKTERYPGCVWMY